MGDPSRPGAVRVSAAAIAAAIVAGLAFGLAGCACSPEGTQETSSQPEKVATPEEAVKAFFDADAKHGTLRFTSEIGDDGPEGQLVEYWFDGERYRLTWYHEDGSERIHMISPDGETRYNCNVEDGACVIAYSPPEWHHWIFNGPPGWTPEGGAQEGDLTVFTYEAKKLWDIEGASQQFYCEDIVVYADGARIVKTVTRTTGSPPESEADLVTSVYTFDDVDLDADIAEDVFELPYPLADVE